MDELIKKLEEDIQTSEELLGSLSVAQGKRRTEVNKKEEELQQIRNEITRTEHQQNLINQEIAELELVLARLKAYGYSTEEDIPEEEEIPEEQEIPEEVEETPEEDSDNPILEEDNEDEEVEEDVVEVPEVPEDGASEINEDDTLPSDSSSDSN